MCSCCTSEERSREKEKCKRKQEGRCSEFAKDKKPYFGKIYAGEQLLNVAISRARHKLIVVCDPDYLEKCLGGVISQKSYSIFKKLLAKRWTKA